MSGSFIKFSLFTSKKTYKTQHIYYYLTILIKNIIITIMLLINRWFC